MKLTLEKLKKVKVELDAMPKPFHNCKICGNEFLVFGEIPEGGYIICGECRIICGDCRNE